MLDTWALTFELSEVNTFRRNEAYNLKNIDLYIFRLLYKVSQYTCETKNILLY